MSGKPTEAVTYRDRGSFHEPAGEPMKISELLGPGADVSFPDLPDRTPERSHRPVERNSGQIRRE